MGTEIKNVVVAVDSAAQYDNNAKRLLGNKYILAYILINSVDEFKGMDPKEIVSYIEGEPFIGVVPVEAGLTNGVMEVNGERIMGLNSENTEVNEGMIRFDIIFYVRVKDGISQIIINVEAQKDEPAGYQILNRAVFYVCRLVSSQKERDFVNTNYNDIKKVFSIWVCMNMNENSMNHIHLGDDKIIGMHTWKGRLDLLNIVLIGLSDRIPEHDETYELHRLLGALLSNKLSADEKLNIIETEYQIPLESDTREDVNVMCNLAEGIREEGREEGRQEMIFEMIQDGVLSKEKAAKKLGITVDELEKELGHISLEKK